MNVYTWYNGLYLYSWIGGLRIKDMSPDIEYLIIGFLYLTMGMIYLVKGILH